MSSPLGNGSDGEDGLGHDLIWSLLVGHLGAPRSLGAGVTTLRSAQTAAGERTYNVLSVEQLFRAKLHALDQRGAERDFGDLQWLCMNHHAEVTKTADSLDEEERRGFLSKYKERYPETPEASIAALMDVLRLGV